MKKEGTIGAAALLAIAAVVGLSVQTGPKPAEGGRADGNAPAKRGKPVTAKPRTGDVRPGCGRLQDELQDFLEIQDLQPHLVLPESCYAPEQVPEQARKRPDRPELTQKTSHLKFVVATLPDPVHTHLPVLFDQFAVAIQEAAQDEAYDFDSAWLPWDADDSSYALFDDQKKSNDETEQKEEQPGIILFRKSDVPVQESYREGLVVFVIGEEATQGIHKAQFRNALSWIRALQPGSKTNGKQLAILGPTFSGSLPPLAQLLRETNVAVQLDLKHPEKSQQLAIYSGSVSSDQAATGFSTTFYPQVVFHSFVQSDPVVLQRFCKYIKNEQPRFEDARVAIISEDETAYGRSDDADGSDNPDDCLHNALRLYYPRDISALGGSLSDYISIQCGTLYSTGGFTEEEPPERPGGCRRKSPRFNPELRGRPNATKPGSVLAGDRCRPARIARALHSAAQQQHPGPAVSHEFSSPKLRGRPGRDSGFGPDVHP